jgi:N-acetylmuramoyl-L-alanine amidase
LTGKVALLMNNQRLDIYIKSTRISIGDKKKRLSLPTRYDSNNVFIPATFITSSDFSHFTETTSHWDSDGNVLSLEKKTNIADPRYYSKEGSTKITVEFLEDLSYDISEKDTHTLVVSFPRGRLNETKIAVNDGIVKDIDLKNRGRASTMTVRLSADSCEIDKKKLSNPARLELNVRCPGKGAGEASPGVVSSTETVPMAMSTDAAAPAPVSAAPAILKKTGPKKIIVLDAGHGGEDPGAVGKAGTKEKDINLAIVKELQRLFENDDDGEYDVFLTRTDDTFIPLVERTSMANEKKAYLFVSVHCNAGSPRSMGGFEIYFLSENASDEEAAATAIMENAVVQLEGKPSKKRAKLQELLWSLMVNEFVNESSELCSFITGEVTRRIKIENRGIKQAGFYVLRGTEMPAVLVECAFLSNAKEEARLRTKKFQSSIADAIFESIKKYDSRRTLVNARKDSE